MPHYMPRGQPLVTACWRPCFSAECILSLTIPPSDRQTTASPRNAFCGRPRRDRGQSLLSRLILSR